MELSEINQTQKIKYHVFSHIWNLGLKTSKQTKRQKHTMGTIGDKAGGRRRTRGRYDRSTLYTLKMSHETHFLNK
jgi:hypothetical protein